MGQVIIILMIVIFGAYVMFSFAYKKTSKKFNYVNGKYKINKIHKELINNDVLSEEIYNQAKSYNQRIAQEGQTDLTSSVFSELEDIDYPELDKYELDIIGNLIISRNKITKIRKRDKRIVVDKIPIYLYASKHNLKYGFVVLKGTSLPIGGKNTFSILFGNKKDNLGLNNQYDIHVGNTIRIETFLEDIEYTVREMCIVQKGEIEKLKIAYNEDELGIAIGDINSASLNFIYCQRKAAKAIDEDE